MLELDISQRRRRRYWPQLLQMEATGQYLGIQAARAYAEKQSIETDDLGKHVHMLAQQF